MAPECITFQLAAGSPYGFRLLGGDNNPFVIAKIRPSSKAQAVGLIEGDVVLGINGISCKGLSHIVATALSESVDYVLALHVLRGMNSIQEVDTAYRNLSNELRPLSESELMSLSAKNPQIIAQPANKFIGDERDVLMTNGHQNTPFLLKQPPGNLKPKKFQDNQHFGSNFPASNFEQSGHDFEIDRSGPGTYSREEESFKEGDTTKHRIKEQQTEKFGNTTITKYTTKEYSTMQYDNRAPEWKHQASVLKPSNQMSNNQEFTVNWDRSSGQPNVHSSTGSHYSTKSESSTNRTFNDNNNAYSQIPQTRVEVQGKQLFVEPGAQIEIQFDQGFEPQVTMQTSRQFQHHPYVESKMQQAYTTDDQFGYQSHPQQQAYETRSSTLPRSQPKNYGNENKAETKYPPGVVSVEIQPQRAYGEQHLNQAAGPKYQTGRPMEGSLTKIAAKPRGGFGIESDSRNNARTVPNASQSHIQAPTNKSTVLPRNPNYVAYSEDPEPVENNNFQPSSNFCEPEGQPVEEPNGEGDGWYGAPTVQTIESAQQSYTKTTPRTLKHGVDDMSYEMDNVSVTAGGPSRFSAKQMIEEQTRKYQSNPEPQSGRVFPSKWTPKQTFHQPQQSNCHDQDPYQQNDEEDYPRSQGSNQNTWKPSTHQPTQSQNMAYQPQNDDESMQHYQSPSDYQQYSDVYNNGPNIYSQPAPNYHHNYSAQQPGPSLPPPGPAPRVPPPSCPAPPAPPPPPAFNKSVYGDRALYDEPGQKHSTLEEKVKVAKSFAQSVTSPENQNSRGQMMFLKRRENSHKWTKTAPTVDEQENAGPNRMQKTNTQNTWAPSKPRSTLQDRAQQNAPYAPPYAPPHAPPYAPPYTPPTPPQMSSYPPSPQFSRQNSALNKPISPLNSPSQGLADNIQQSNDKGSKMFARRKANSEKWVAAESEEPVNAPRNNASDDEGRRGPPNMHYNTSSTPPPPAANKQINMIRSKQPTLTSWNSSVIRGTDNVQGNQTPPHDVPRVQLHKLNVSQSFDQQDRNQGSTATPPAINIYPASPTKSSSTAYRPIKFKAFQDTSSTSVNLEPQRTHQTTSWKPPPNIKQMTSHDGFTDL